MLSLIPLSRRKRHQQQAPSASILILALLLAWQLEPTAAAVSATWSSLGQWSTSPFDNYTEYTFRYKTFDLLRLVSLSKQYEEAEMKCANTETRLPRMEDLAGDLFQRYIFNNNDFIKVGVTKQVLQSVDSEEGRGYGQFKTVQQWSLAPGQFFLASPLQREKQLVGLAPNEMQVTKVNSESIDIGGNQPSIILCVKERHLARPPPPPPPPPPVPVAPSSSSSSSSNLPCACGSGVHQAGIGGSGLDFAWPLAAVAFLGVLCLSLATALLIVCRTRRRAAEKAAAAAAAAAVEAVEAAGLAASGGGGGGAHIGKNGNSIPRTASSLMDFPAGQHYHHHHLHEKAHSMAAQATMPRRPRVIHHGQVHNNGYLTLGSIQARKQRELMHHHPPGPHDLGLSEPPSPNHSIARSDYQHR